MEYLAKYFVLRNRSSLTVSALSDIHTSGMEYYYRCTLPYTLGLIHADQSRWSPSKEVEMCKRAGIPEADGPFTTPATCYPIY